MSKLSIQLVSQHLLSESEEVKAKYATMKSPDSKTKAIGTPKDPSGKMTKIKQIEVPTSHKGGGKKSSGGKGANGIPQAKRADQIADNKAPVPGWSKAKAEKSPSTPAVKKTKPNQTQKQTAVTGAIKRTEAGKGPKANTIPAADFADKYVAKMPHGSKTMITTGDRNVPEVKAPAAANLHGTTSPSRSPAKMKSREPGSQTVAQITHGGGMTKSPSDAPGKVSYAKAVKGHNVMESVEFVINGSPKASFGIINRSVAKKLVESYQGFGYKVEVRRSNKPSWKQDKVLMKSIFEAVDAHYNNAPVSASRARKAAMNLFFRASVGDYNSMYESRQMFTETLRSAFGQIMAQADIQYRRKLLVMEGLARVQIGDEIVDLEMITQARNTDMALRNFRNEIVEEYGFGAKIKHVFIEGEKFGPRDITEWTNGKNRSRK